MSRREQLSKMHISGLCGFQIAHNCLYFYSKRHTVIFSSGIDLFVTQNLTLVYFCDIEFIYVCLLFAYCPIRYFIKKLRYVIRRHNNYKESTRDRTFTKLLITHWCILLMCFQHILCKSTKCFIIQTMTVNPIV